MNHSGDAAEQIVRMSLEGVEVAAKITGLAAKEVALLLMAALKSNDSNLKLKGKARLTSMLKSGKPLEIFSVKESDLKQFVAGAKEYGIVYCVLRNPKNSPDGLCDVMVKADDAPKISRLVERFHFATVDKAKIEHELVAERAAREGAVPEAPASGQAAPDVGDTEKLLDELLGEPDGRAEPEQPQPTLTEPVQTEPVRPGKEQPESRPFVQDAPPTTPLSEPISESKNKSAKGISSKPSVKQELREIKAAQKAKEAAQGRDEQPAADKPRDTPKTTHKQPQSNGKQKSKKPKVRS
ncbi:MAG: PcfB family protein [Oscillibacter sp.]|nr:PcfB family protein [Oscillibacter sp.]MEA4992516.1 PcfB family protein [Oscillibacter sp.]